MLNPLMLDDSKQRARRLWATSYGINVNQTVHPNTDPFDWSSAGDVIGKHRLVMYVSSRGNNSITSVTVHGQSWTLLANAGVPAASSMGTAIYARQLTPAELAARAVTPGGNITFSGTSNCIHVDLELYDQLRSTTALYVGCSLSASAGSLSLGSQSYLRGSRGRVVFASRGNIGGSIPLTGALGWDGLESRYLALGDHTRIARSLTGEDVDRTLTVSGDRGGGSAAVSMGAAFFR